MRTTVCNSPSKLEGRQELLARLLLLLLLLLLWGCRRGLVGRRRRLLVGAAAAAAGIAGRIDAAGSASVLARQRACCWGSAASDREFERTDLPAAAASFFCHGNIWSS